jgi:acetylornithine deacetylase/succinyl-diaminopimelate desuccinylase family protein
VTSSVTQALSDYVAQHHDAQVAFLRRLVQTPSDNPPGDCAQHAVVAAELLEQLGFTVERHVVPEEVVRRNGMISATNLIVRHSFGPGPTVALNAHGDVVPPGLGWVHDPYGGEIVDGRMYGRGVAVSKSDFATYAYALKALIDLKLPLAGTVELHFTYDEEVGGLVGPGWLLEQGLTKPDYAISAGFSYGIVTAHNGCLHLEVRVRGKQAHAAMPKTGHDALEASTAILAALYAHRRTLDERQSAMPGITSPSLNVGLIKGGINTNVVPDLVTLRLDRRLIPEENGAEVERELRQVIEQASQGLPGITVEVERILLAEPLKPGAGTERLVQAIKAYADPIQGEDIKAHGVPLYTDARLYAAAGVPTVLYGAGPRTILDANAHAGNENLKLDDLRKATIIVAGALSDLLTAS